MATDELHEKKPGPTPLQRGGKLPTSQQLSDLEEFPDLEPTWLRWCELVDQAAGQRALPAWSPLPDEQPTRRLTGRHRFAQSVLSRLAVAAAVMLAVGFTGMLVGPNSQFALVARDATAEKTMPDRKANLLAAPELAASGNDSPAANTQYDAPESAWDDTIENRLGQVYQVLQSMDHKIELDDAMLFYTSQALQELSREAEQGEL